MTESTDSGFDIHEVMKYLPHRYPFLMIDRVIDYKAGEYLKAIKNVTMNEPYFIGHFPARPVMPGVMILEAVAQASALFAAREAGEEVPENRIYLFAGADDVRFKRPVEPGDQLVFTVMIKRRMRNIWVCSGEVTVDDKVVCTANLKFTYRDI